MTTTEFAIGQHVRLTGRIHVIRSPRSREGASYIYTTVALFPRDLSEVTPVSVEAYLIQELTEADLCRRRSVESFCTCGGIHVPPGYVIGQRR